MHLVRAHDFVFALVSKVAGTGLFLGSFVAALLGSNCLVVPVFEDRELLPPGRDVLERVVASLGENTVERLGEEEKAGVQHEVRIRVLGRIDLFTSGAEEPVGLPERSLGDFLAVRDLAPERVHIMEDVPHCRARLTMQETFCREEEGLGPEEPAEARDERAAFARHDEHVEPSHEEQRGDVRVACLHAVLKKLDRVLQAHEAIIIGTTDALIHRIEIARERLFLQVRDLPQQRPAEGLVGLGAADVIPSLGRFVECEEDVLGAIGTQGLEGECCGMRERKKLTADIAGKVLVVSDRTQPKLRARKFLTIMLGNVAFDNRDVPTDRPKLANTNVLVEIIGTRHDTIMKRSCDHSQHLKRSPKQHTAPHGLRYAHQAVDFTPPPVIINCFRRCGAWSDQSAEVLIPRLWCDHPPPPT